MTAADAAECDKLPPYDEATWAQPPGAFFCHQDNGRLCAGWVAVHDMDESLGLRIALAVGLLTGDDVEAARAYTTPVALWGSGAEAAEHGKRDIEQPGQAARDTAGKIRRKRALA